jgi:hypothetical protein
MRRQSTTGVVIAFAAIVTMVLAARLEIRGFAQAPAAGRGTGLLMGAIVDALDNRPVGNAEVTLGGASPAVPNTKLLTDADGQFVFLDLPTGTYTITATKAGYADGAFGRRRPSGLTQVLKLADGERLGDLKIPIWKYGAITGTIRDEAGDPMVEAPVRVLTRTIVAGKRKLTPGVITRTDDRGVYRIGSLTPGEYVVAVPSTQASAPESVVEMYRNGRGLGSGATFDQNVYRDFQNLDVITAFELFIRPDIVKVNGLAFVSSSASGVMRAGTAPMPSSDGRIFVYPTQYHAAASIIAEATIVTVRSGEERAGVDVQLKLSPSARVSGVVTGPDGPLMTAMYLAPDTDDLSTDNSFETATTMSDAAGRFTFLGVPPGQYQLHAFKGQVTATGLSRGAAPPAPARAAQTPAAPLGGGFTLTATQTIGVSSTDLDGLAITLRPGFRISGRADFKGATTPDPDLVRRMYATIDPADARPMVSAILGRGQFQDDGQFSSYPLPPGRYYLRMNNAPAGWTLKAAMWNGQDISNTPIKLDRDVSGVVITFTDRPSALSGQVQTASGAPDPTATVLIFPADPGSWVDYGAFPRRLRAVRVGRDGRYAETGLPPGDYRVVAIDEETSANWQDPRTLPALARLGTAITLSDEETRTVMLQTVKR